LFLAVFFITTAQEVRAVLSTPANGVEEAKTTLIWCTMKMFSARAFIAIIYIFRLITSAVLRRLRPAAIILPLKGLFFALLLAARAK
jgi:hypothetical protein